MWIFSLGGVVLGGGFSRDTLAFWLALQDIRMHKLENLMEEIESAETGELFVFHLLL